MAPKRGGPGRGRGRGRGSRGGALDKETKMCTEPTKNVDYCVISDFEADDFIAILILIGHIIATTKQLQTLHIHISGSKGPTLKPPITHLQWYEKHAKSLTTFLDIINSITYGKIIASVSCSMDLDVLHNQQLIKQPGSPLYATNLFLIGPMYDMGITCNENTQLITGQNVYAYFGYNVPQMYVDQSRFIGKGVFKNVFDQNASSQTIDEIAKWQNDMNAVDATNWLQNILKPQQNIKCYLKPPSDSNNALENFNMDINTLFKSTLFESFVKEFKKAEEHEPQTFIDFLRKGIPKFITLWETKIIDPITTHLPLDKKDLSDLKIFRSKITNLNSFFYAKQKLIPEHEIENLNFSATIDAIFAKGTIYDKIPDLYSQVPINPGCADSMPIVGFIHNQVTRVNLVNCLQNAVDVFKPKGVEGFRSGGKGKSTNNAWISHVRSVYQKSLGSGNPLSWMQAMKAAKATYSKKK